MKKFAIYLLAAALLLSLAGCRVASPADTTPNTQPTQTPTAPTSQPTQTPTTPTGMPQGSANTQSARILANIWGAYDAGDRFAAYGGAIENSVADGPGDLDMMNTEELAARYLIPDNQLANVEEGASLVHLMNNNIFTGAVFKLTGSADTKTFAKALRDNIQGNRWLCGQPDKLIIADMGENHVLMAFASTDAMATFLGHLRTVYADASLLYEETILA